MDFSNYTLLQTWAQRNAEVPLFYLMAFIAIPLAYGVLFDPRIIRCGFLLIGVFGAVAGLFFILQAQFLGLAQIMIYAVGISLVVVIALMLTNPKLEHDTSPLSDQQKGPALSVSIILFITIYLGLRSETWQSHGSAPIAYQDNVMQIGKALIGPYLLPFEFASILLLIALVGAIVLAKQDRPPRANEIIGNSQEERSGDRDVVKV